MEHQLENSSLLRKQYSFNSIFLLPVNLYGPKDNFDLESSHVIPALIRKFYEAKINKKDTVILWGDGTPTREFLFVEDCAEAIILATKKYNKSDPINIGSSKEISINNLAQLIANGKVSPDLANKKLIQLDVSSLVAGGVGGRWCG
jgi:GDP-L-fucose synthase